MNGSNVQQAQAINARMYRFDRAHAPLASPAEFTDDHVRQYREQGFVAIEGMLAPGEAEACIAALMELIMDPEPKAKIQFTRPQRELATAEERELAVRKVYDYVDAHPALHAAAFHPAIGAVVGKLLGEPAKLAQDQALLKPPYGGGEKPWHQDMAYGNLSYEKAVVGVWIALDEAGLDNGCMHVIPGSHADGANPHYAVRDWQLCDANVAVDRDVAVPLKPGGALFFHGLLHHGTPFNVSAKRRRALQFHYAPAPSVKLSPGEYKRMFTNEMTSAEC
ncbi:phytanoyl-CoA dioxygenase family protein [Paenibacillus sp. MWE-103]|uniref:Phytanoyl-CoA dioxygenase family protein n=1 Tax=Paenibacillus artemisiicola TaxID=1172618 RepID=A0ABS3W3G5_9BACL|nr:phytanoyl-CoA dioxygenase family protein [Paenibacillus artemisiicola]MBO7742846.1 phytanoyl-CoA dioxygenase family protein [Paenibacillus artemisiicola]